MILGYIGWAAFAAALFYLFKVRSDLTRESLERRSFEDKLAALQISFEDRARELENLKNEKLVLETTHDVQMQELQRFKTLAENYANENIALKESKAALQANNTVLQNEKSEFLETQKNKIREYEEKLEKLRVEKNEADKKLSAFEESREEKQRQYDKQMATLENVYKQQEQERQRALELQEQKEQERLALLKETWSRHEKSVEENIKVICQRQSIEYIDKENFPYRGKPDNCVRICDEFIIFDSKSPQGEDLKNFPAYIKREGEALKKYAKNEGVKKDIFLVVPTNAIHVIDEYYRPYGDYRVYVITEDALEPILLSLKKIEDYEFAEKLSPEGREKIVSILGKMAHGMKRRVQVDHFFANEFISVLLDAESLPEDILAEAQQVERSSKLNPPQEKRSKAIETQALMKDAVKLEGRARGQEINTQADLGPIEQIPLYTKD